LAFTARRGAFFLWLDVGDDEAATKRIWAEQGVKVIPGSYLSITAPDGSNPGKQFIRIALVHDLETTREGLSRINDALAS
jgi:aspartate/methionine/tyrosine aminotransferase